MRLGVAERPVELAEVLEAGGEDLTPVRRVQAVLAEEREARQQPPVAAPAPASACTPGM